MSETTLEERIVRFWNDQPCNIKHGKSELGSLQYFQEVTERRYLVGPGLQDLAEFDLWKNRRVLEIGCGMGGDAAEFARRGADYVGIDISDKTVELAVQRFKVENLAGQFICGDGSDGDLYNGLGKFDLVYSCGVLHHHPKINEMIANAYHVLKDQGEFRFMVYAKNSWKYAMIQAGLDQFEAQAGCPFAEAYSHEDIYAMLTGKFQITSLKQTHCFMYNIEAYKQGRYELEPWFAAMSETMRQAIHNYLGWHLLVKAKKI